MKRRAIHKLLDGLNIQVVEERRRKHLNLKCINRHGVPKTITISTTPTCCHAEKNKIAEIKRFAEQTEWSQR